MSIRFGFSLLFALALGASVPGMHAQAPAPAPTGPTANAHAGDVSPAISPAPVAAAGEIRGKVKSGNTPLPGVSISAANTLTGKKVITSTDLDGTFVLTVPSNGRYVVRAELAAFATATKEVLINAASRNAQADLELVLLSRAPTAAAANVGDLARRGSVVAGRGSQQLSVTADQGASEASAASEAPQNMPALASSPDAANESLAISGALGQTQDFGRNIDDIRDRIDEMRARGELPGGQGGQGGPGGGGGGIFVMGGGPGGGFGGGRGRMGRFNVNQPHGQLFYSMGNSALDATPFSLSGAPGTKPDYASNRFGGTIGGPLRIPHVFDAGPNTFFFFNMFGTRATTPYQVFSHVPTVDERNGIFSQSIIDPTTGLLFASNTIPSDRMNSAALGLLKFIPLPNQPGAQNFLFSSSAENSSTNVAFRLMHNFSSQPTGGGRRGGGGGRGMFGRNNLNFGLNYSTSNIDQLRPFPTIGGTSHSKGLNANAGYTVSRGKWTNNLRATFNRSRTNLQNFYAGVDNVAGDLGIKGVSQNPADWGVPNLLFSHFQGLTDINPVSRRDDVFQIMDTIIVSRAKHNVRLGGDYRRTNTALRNNTNPRGTFTFTGFNTGFDFADFLLGTPQQTSIQFSPNAYQFRSNGFDLYVNDDWRPRGNLTLELGLRYEYIGPFTETHNQIVNLDVTPGFTTAAPVQPGQAGPFGGSFPASLVKPDRNNFAPRVGIAWKPFSKTVVRAGYGINYNLGQYRTIVQNLAFQPPFSFTQTNLASPLNPLTLQNGFPAVVGQVTNNYGVDPNYVLGYVQMWNLNIQRDIGWGSVLNVGYTGSKGTALDMVRAPNRGPDGLRIPGVQPFLWESSQGSSILHAASARLRKRMQNGISLGATYVFSKSIDNASSIGGTATVVAQNDLDLAAERGLSSFDQRHRFTGDYVVDLPFGEGRKWLNTSSGMLSHLFGAWEWSGSFTIASGTPFTARVLGAVSDVARGTNGTLRADVTGLPISLSNPSVDEWFNTAAFIPPAGGQFGDAGRNTIIGPGTIVFNMSMSKNFPMKDMMNLEVRADATNVFNTPQFTGIDTAVNSPTFGQVISVGATRRIQISTRFRF